jgi:hypothetical protein
MDTFCNLWYEYLVIPTSDYLGVEMVVADCILGSIFLVYLFVMLSMLCFIRFRSKQEK